jgi:hypothetical protein
MSLPCAVVGIGPDIAQGAEACFLLRDVGHDIKQVAGAAGQPVKASDQQYVAVIEGIEKPCQAAVGALLRR